MKYGLFARSSTGELRLCVTTEAEDSVQAGLKLQTWADAVLGDTFWYVARINKNYYNK
jgi:hypothetical protein